MSAASTQPSAEPSTSAVVARDLLLAYGEQTAVCDATFALPQRGVTAIIGPNGSGKTTLLRAISGLEPIRRGELEVLGRPAGDNRGQVSHVMQTNRVNEAVPLTVIEVVRMGRYAPGRMLGRLSSGDHDAVRAAMERMLVADLAHRQVRELSGGQQQRVFVAQGLAQQAELLLLDEPITGLDVTSQEHINRAIGQEIEVGHAVVFTTHDVATAARADHVLLLATHVVASGPPDQVLTDEHLSAAYSARTYRTTEGTLIIGEPHVHGRKEPPSHDHDRG